MCTRPAIGGPRLRSAVVGFPSQELARTGFGRLCFLTGLLIGFSLSRARCVREALNGRRDGYGGFRAGGSTYRGTFLRLSLPFDQWRAGIPGVCRRRIAIRIRRSALSHGRLHTSAISTGLRSWLSEPAASASSFSKPTSVAVDSSGNEYVASYGTGANPEGSQGRIDIFGPNGKFISELKDPSGPKSLAVDSKGNLYVFERFGSEYAEIARYSPSKYEPVAGKVEYEPGSRVVIDSGPAFAFQGGVAVDASNDRLFATTGAAIREYGSAVEGNSLLNTIADSHLHSTVWVAVDAQRRRLYASSCPSGDITECWVLVFNADAPHELLAEVDGSTRPPENSNPTRGGPRSRWMKKRVTSSSTTSS